MLIYFHDVAPDAPKAPLFAPYEFRGNVNSVALVVRPVSDDKVTRVLCFNGSHFLIGFFSLW